MIDIEDQIITIVGAAVRAVNANTFVTSVFEQIPSKFPCVYITEADNYVYSRSIDSESNENHVNVMYEIQVFTNEAKARKAKCKELFAAADEAMLNLGFVRNTKNAIEIKEATVCRIIGRYTAVVSKNNEISGR